MAKMGLTDWISEKRKSKDVKMAKEGHDFGKKNKKGTGFKSVEKKAAKEYGSEEQGKKVAAAAFWKQRAKAGKK